MKVRYENTRAKVTEATVAELEWLDSYLTFEDKTKFFLRNKFGRGDPFLRLLDKRNNTFPAGLVSMAQKAAIEESIAVEAEDGRPKPCAWDLGADLEWLRDDQFKAVETIHSETRGILHLPTGAGKTEIACGLIKALPCHWLFVVHRKDLMWQAAKRWQLRSATTDLPGIIGDGTNQPDPKRRLTCATFQTLARGLTRKDPVILDLLRDAEGLIIDECHVCPAQSFWKVVMETRRAYYRVGLSGTPLARGDRRSVYAIAAIGPVVYRIMPEKLIDLGVLARPKIKAVKLVQPLQTKTWDSAYKALICDSAVRNRLIVEIAKKAAKPMFVFVKNVEHGRTLSAGLNQHGIRTEFVWGERATAQRESAIKNLRYGELDAIVCSVIFQEGIDVPELESVINAAGMSSSIAALQRIGRGMRSNSGTKDTFEVWDIKDEGNKFMQRHAQARLRAYKKEGHKVEVVSPGSITGV